MVTVLLIACPMAFNATDVCFLSCGAPGPATVTDGSARIIEAEHGTFRRES